MTTAIAARRHPRVQGCASPPAPGCRRGAFRRRRAWRARRQRERAPAAEQPCPPPPPAPPPARQFRACAPPQPESGPRRARSEALVVRRPGFPRLRQRSDKRLQLLRLRGAARGSDRLRGRALQQRHAVMIQARVCVRNRVFTQFLQTTRRVAAASTPSPATPCASHARSSCARYRRARDSLHTTSKSACRTRVSAGARAPHAQPRRRHRAQLGHRLDGGRETAVHTPCLAKRTPANTRPARPPGTASAAVRSRRCTPACGRERRKPDGLPPRASCVVTASVTAHSSVLNASRSAAMRRESIAADIPLLESCKT